MFRKAETDGTQTEHLKSYTYNIGPAAKTEQRQRITKQREQGNEQKVVDK